MYNNENAVAAYVENLTKCKKTLEALSAWIDGNMGCNTNEVNWGHVGSAGHLLDLLNEAAEFLGLET